MALPQAAGNVSTSLWSKLNSDHLLEGAFWGVWSGFYVYSWIAATGEKEIAEKLPESAEKADRVWQAQKNYNLSLFSLVTGISMITSWLEEIQVIYLGTIGTIISTLGFSGSSIVSTVSLLDTLVKIGEQVKKFQQADHPQQKKIALEIFFNMINLAFFTALAAWGAFGALHAAFGGGALYHAMDASLYYAAILFVPSVTCAVVRANLDDKTCKHTNGS